MVGALAVLLLAATPAWVTRGDLTPEATVRAEAEAAWRELEARYAAEAGGVPARPPGAVVLRRSQVLAPGRNGQGTPGQVELRQATPGVVDERLRLALRHELAHQVLWWACPAAAEDRLFHEAFAVAVSGELEAWREGPYQSLGAAAAVLAREPGVDTPRARRALARLLGEGGGLPKALQRRLRRCQDNAPWGAPLAVEELAEVPVPEGLRATVVLSRHSGEVLLAEGEVRRALPYGSTLKPFVVAAARETPVLAPRGGMAEWVCGQGLPARVEAAQALVRSCNGYFLDWEARGGAPVALGAWGEVLEAVGLSGRPADMAEAIGLKATLRISPWGLAQAYRLLAEARPELIKVLRGTAERGTLAGLPGSGAYAGVGVKTGTVRDTGARPLLGWVVAVDEDMVVVVARAGRQPRSFAEEVPGVLRRVREQGVEAARVQALGLLPPESVEASCRGAGYVLEAGEPRALPTAFGALGAWVRKGPAVCLGAPWRVRFPGLPEEGRDYAGVFAWSPAPPYVPPVGVPVGERAQRARRGSDYVFRTTRLQYTAGVVAAEDSELRGEPRVALARVVAHNERQGGVRHGGRPVCDTTHCQTFKGTVRVRPEEARALREGPLRWKGWLPFSQGGETPWREERPRGQVESLLGAGVAGLRFEGGRVYYMRARREGGAVFDEAVEVACEVVRSGLKLPSCPRRASFEAERVVFEGRGQGHGEGLDVEAAKASKLPQEKLLEQAYGRPGQGG